MSKTSPKRFYLDTDVVFTSFFTVSSISHQIESKVVKEYLLPLYQYVLGSPHLPEEIKEIIVESRYVCIDFMDHYYKLILGNIEIQDIIKNISESNSSLQIEKLRNIMGAQPDPDNNNATIYKQIGEAQDQNRYSDGKGTPYPHKVYNKNTAEVFDALRKYKKNIESSTLGNPILLLQRGSYNRTTLSDKVRDNALLKFLTAGELINKEDIEELCVIEAANELLRLNNSLIDKYSYRIYNTDNYELLRRQTPSMYESMIQRAFISSDLKHAIVMSNLLAGTDTKDYNSYVERTINSFRKFEPLAASKSSNVDRRSAFAKFVEGISATYDVEEMAQPEHEKGIIKILNKLAKKISSIYNVPLKATPEDTVSSALRSFSHDSDKMDSIYDLVDAAVNECYDLVFGKEPPESD